MFVHRTKIVRFMTDSSNKSFLIWVCPICKSVKRRLYEVNGLLSSRYHLAVSINVLCLFLTMPLTGLQRVIVALPGHTYLLFMELLSKRTYQSKQYCWHGSRQSVYGSNTWNQCKWCFDSAKLFSTNNFDSFFGL